MKNKKIIISIIGLLLISSLFIILISKNNNKYIMQDGIMLALSLDGENIKSFPDGTNYSVEIDCTNAKGIWNTESWKLNISDITGNVICNLDFYTRDSNDKLKMVVESKATQYSGSNNEDAGYRYSGQNPNNYIWFNNEMWRIIGSIPTKQIDGSTTNLVKIIRNDSIGELSYDAKVGYYEATGTWGSNTIYTLLNSNYYATNVSNLNGNNSIGCYTYKNYVKANCDYTDIGILSTSYYGKMVQEVYWNSGAVDSHDTTALQAYSSELTNQTVKGYIGLITVGDYGYAFDSKYHNSNMGEFYYDNYATYNWLYGQGYEWTISLLDGNSAFAGAIAPRGETSAQHALDNASVRPAVYLDSNVYIVSGNGTITNPYQIIL